MFKSVKSLHIHKLQLGIILSKETLLHYAVFTMILYVLLSHGLILRDRLCCDSARDLIKLDIFQAVLNKQVSQSYLLTLLYMRGRAYYGPPINFEASQL